MQFNGLADQDEIKPQGFAGAVEPLFVERLEDIRLRAGGQTTQEARDLIVRFDERFKQTGINALLAQHAGGTGLLRAHDTNRPAQGMTKCPAEQRTLKRRQKYLLPGSEAKTQTLVRKIR